jgi:hypothetical protein
MQHAHLLVRVLFIASLVYDRTLKLKFVAASSLWIEGLLTLIVQDPFTGFSERYYVQVGDSTFNLHKVT